MRIALIEPFFGGSHKRWSEDFRDFSGHEVHLFTSPGRHWKWRMHESGLNLAEAFNASPLTFDRILVSDMLDLTTFKAFAKPNGDPEYVLYFHENQLTYPWSGQDEDQITGRSRHYGWINYVSALAADQVWFNSEYHRNSFLEALPEFLNAYPDRRGLHRVVEIQKKARTVPLQLNLKKFDAHRPKEQGTNEIPVLLWNHRWEYDKNPEAFFEVLFRLRRDGLNFHLAVLGQNNRRYPPIFDRAKEELADCIVQWGPVDSMEEYASWLHKSDIIPVTSNQDFFGISAVEAMYCGVTPLLPKRLAFPEHIVGEEYFYDRDDELHERLKEWIQHPNKKPAPVQEQVLKYTY